MDMSKILGFTKFTVDKFTFSVDTQPTNAVSHSLGTKPKLAIIIPTSLAKKSMSITTVLAIDNPGSSYKPTCSVTYYNSPYTINSYVNGSGVSFTESQISFSASSSKYGAGIEYNLITMA